GYPASEDKVPGFELLLKCAHDMDDGLFRHQLKGVGDRQMAIFKQSSRLAWRTENLEEPRLEGPQLAVRRIVEVIQVYAVAAIRLEPDDVTKSFGVAIIA